MFDQMLDPTAVAKAAERLKGIVNHTPVMTSRTLDLRTGRRVFLKCENFQRVGAFKFRGAYNALSQLNPRHKAAGVITHSSGNHAQGLALAARLLDIKATIVMPDDAPRIKQEATSGYGAEIIFCNASERERVSAELVKHHGFTLIHPYDNNEIIAGAGTAAWELFEEIGELDALFVPVGGGGLISGSALAAAARSPGCRVIGVEPEQGDDAGRSWRSNNVVRLEQAPDTLADGLRTRFVGERNLPLMRRYVSDMTTVTEGDILETLRFLWVRMKLLVEPSAAVALTPLLSGRYKDVGSRIGVILSGGNVDIGGLGPRVFGQSGEVTVLKPQLRSESRADEPRRPRVLVTDTMDVAGLEILRQNTDVELRQDISEDQLLAEVGNYHALIVGRNRPVNEQTIEYGFSLQAIGVLSSRLDNVDVSTARNMGIEVCSASAGRAVAIAEHTMARLLQLAERFGDGSLARKTLGLVGFGRVGREVAQRAKAFDMRILVNQPRLTPQLALSEGVEAIDLARLLELSDFVSLHVPRGSETRALIGTEELAHLKSMACLVNTGHTDLIDEEALLGALQLGQLRAAALSAVPQVTQVTASGVRLRQHDRVIESPHVLSILESQDREISLSVAEQVVATLHASQPSETLSLELVPIDQVVPHEDIDDKRVERLVRRLESDGQLVNPPVTVKWKGQYVILDGATRFTALNRIGCPHIVVQVVDPAQTGFELHTWYHAISSEAPLEELRTRLQRIEHLGLSSLPSERRHEIFLEKDALCYFLDRDGRATLVEATDERHRLNVLTEVVKAYMSWGEVERTLLTDLPRLMGQFPKLAAVTVFPQYQPETVFEVAGQGKRMPAGLTRFVIPGRILRLNADLERLRSNEPLASKRAWFNEFLGEKLGRSRMRYYQEPIILLDE